MTIQGEVGCIPRTQRNNFSAYFVQIKLNVKTTDCNLHLEEIRAKLFQIFTRIIRFIYYYLQELGQLSHFSDYATGWTFWGSNPGRDKTLFSSSKRPDWL